MEPLHLQGVHWVVVKKEFRENKNLIGVQDSAPRLVPHFSLVVDGDGEVVPYHEAIKRRSYMKFATKEDAIQYIADRGL